VEAGSKPVHSGLGPASRHNWSRPRSHSALFARGLPPRIFPRPFRPAAGPGFGCPWPAPRGPKALSELLLRRSLGVRAERILLVTAMECRVVTIRWTTVAVATVAYEAMSLFGRYSGPTVADTPRAAVPHALSQGSGTVREVYRPPRRVVVLAHKGQDAQPHTSAPTQSSVLIQEGEGVARRRSIRWVSPSGGAPSVEDIIGQGQQAPSGTHPLARPDDEVCSSPSGGSSAGPQLHRHRAASLSCCPRGARARRPCAVRLVLTLNRVRQQVLASSLRLPSSRARRRALPAAAVTAPRQLAVARPVLPEPGPRRPAEGKLDSGLGRG